MSQLTKQQLKGENQTQFPNNNSGLITPANLRAFNVDMIDSTVNQTDFDSFSGSVASEIDNLEAFSSSLSTAFVTTQSFNTYTQSTDAAIAELENWSSSLDVSAITASSLQTASFDSGSRNLTFTKGDNTTFSVNIPDASGSILATGSFATTGSNSFTGSQSISGSVSMTGSFALRSQEHLFPITFEIDTAGAPGDFRFSGNDVEFTLNNGDLKVLNLTAGKGFQVNGPDPVIRLIDTTTPNANLIDFQNTNSTLRITAINGGTFPIATFNTASAEILEPTRISGSLTVTGSVNITDTITASLAQGFALVGGAGNRTIAVATSSFGQAFAFPSLETISGAVLITANGFTSGAASIDHISESTVNSANLIFKTSNVTQSTFISGSGNIINNPVALVGDRIVYMSSNNIALGVGAVSSLTSSAASITGSRPTISHNIVTSTAGAAIPFTINQSPNGGTHIINANIITGGGYTINALGSTGNMIISNNVGASPMTINAASRSIAEINAGATGSNNVNISSIFGYGALAYNGPVSQSAAQGHNIFSNYLGANMNLNLQSGSRVYNINNNILSNILTVNDNTVFAPTLGSNNSIVSNLISGVSILNQSGSASLQMVGNVGGGFTLNNQLDASLVTNAAQRLLTVNNNIVNGITNIINVSGSQGALPTGRTCARNIVVGSANTLNLIGDGSLNSMLDTGIIGSNLIVSGSSSGATNGSLFAGRFNATDGNRAKSFETVFAIGTGTSTAVRRTGFLIDNNSNSFFDGAVSVSGSLSINGVPVTAVNTASFATTGSNTFTGVNIFNDRVAIQGINLLTGSDTTNIYLGSRTNFNPATTGVPSQFSHTVVGFNALNNFVLGDRNTVMGRGALQMLATGSDNLALGAFAGEGLIEGNTNFFVGTGAGASLQFGSENFFLGQAAANQFRSGSGNIVIGSAIGFQLVSGSGNLIIGRYGANVADNVDNQFSVTYGRPDAGAINLFYKSGSQSDNLYLYGGLEVQNPITASRASITNRLNVNGDINIYTGSEFGIYIGNLTNFAPTSVGTLPPNANIVIGHNALQTYATGFGDMNIAIGRNTLASMQTGSLNLGLGSFAGTSFISGTANTFIGDQAGNGFQIGDNNFFLGSSAGNSFRSGSDNTFIGVNTGGTLATGSGNLIIGPGLTAVDNVNNQFALTYGESLSRRRLFYKSGSEADNLYTYGGLEVQNSITASGITITSGSGDLFVHGHKQFNCGAFQSNVTQSGSANVSQSVNFDTTDVSYGVSLTNNSRLNVANAGVYLITFSAQVLADTGADTIYLWLKKNGTNVPESATKLTLANNDAELATVTFVNEAAANDYYEVAWQSNNGDAVLYTEAAAGNIPAIPSIVATITQVR